MLCPWLKYGWKTGFSMFQLMMTTLAWLLQGLESFRGPFWARSFLYAIFVSPLFDLHKLSNYADDNFVVRWNSNKNDLVVDMQADLEAMTKWSRQSGLCVNESKTEMCLFHRNYTRLVTLTINNTIVTSTPQINVLGVIFDTKLQWNEQISKTVKKQTKPCRPSNL